MCVNKYCNFIYFYLMEATPQSDAGALHSVMEHGFRKRVFTIMMGYTLRPQYTT